MKDGGFLTRLFIGAFMILLGVGFMLDQLGLNFLGFNVFNFWPLIFFVFAIPMFAKRNFVVALVFLMLGTAFLAANFFGYSIFAIIWPAIIIIIGISIIFKPNRHHSWSDHGSSASVSKDRLEESVVFWGMDQKVNSDNFVGGNVECVFGGFKIDLRDAKISKDNAALELSAVFGGGELILPRDVRVQVESNGVMGGVTNNTVSGKDSDPLIKIKASAVFGGIDIKN